MLERVAGLVADSIASRKFEGYERRLKIVVGSQHAAMYSHARPLAPCIEFGGKERLNGPTPANVSRRRKADLGVRFFSAASFAVPVCRTP